MPQYRFKIVFILLLLGIFVAKLKSDGNSNVQEERKSFQAPAPKTKDPKETGKSVYMTYCMSCHQTDGSGVPNLYPGLINTDWVNGDKNRLINVILKGLQGPITVNGKLFNGNMPKQDYLTDKQIADLLTFLRSNFGNRASEITPEEVAKLR